MQKNRSEKYVKFLVYIVVIVLINIAGISLLQKFKIDLTTNNLFSLSKASKKVISTLSEPLTIKVFFTKNLPSPHNGTEQYLQDLLDEYAANGNRHFNCQFFDVSPDEGINEETNVNRSLAENYGIHPVQIRVAEQDEIKFKKAYMGLVLIHGDLIERIPTILSTNGLEYKITNAIQKLNNKTSALLSLQENIKIKLYLSSSLKILAPHLRLNELSSLESNLKETVSKMSTKNYDKLEFQHIDPDTDNILEKDIEKYNIMALQWPAQPRINIEAGSGKIGLVIEYGEKFSTVKLLNVINIPIFGTQYNLVDTSQMEDIINENIETLIDINENIGYLADHGTLDRLGMEGVDPSGRPMRDTMNSFSSLVAQNYSIKDVKLKEETIPEGLKCLIIARPTEQFSDYELFRIDQMLMQGTNLALFIDSFNEMMPQQQQSFRMNQGPVYFPINTGLSKLLSHYGIRISKSYVMDESCYKQPQPAYMGGGEIAIPFAPIIKSQQIDQDRDFMKSIKELIGLKLSPIELDEKKIKDNLLKTTRLFTSSDRAWEMSGRIDLNPMRIETPEDEEEFSSYDLAYLIEGEFPSYFKGKPVPIKEVEKETADSDIEKDNKPDVDMSQIVKSGDMIEKSKPAKILIVGSSEMLKDNLIDQEGQSTNALLIMNLLDVLNGREDIAVMRSREQGFNPLDDSTPGAKLAAKSFNIAGLPVLVVLFGFFILLRRGAKRKQIQMMFEK